MTTLFYYIGFLLFVSYIPMLISYLKIKKLQYSYKINPGVKNYEIIKKTERPMYMKLLIYGLTMLISLLWLIVGLLSNNWLIFLCIIITYITLEKIISYIGDKKKMNYTRALLHMFLYTVLSFSMLFISLNHFFFKYDLSFHIKSMLGIL